MRRFKEGDLVVYAEGQEAAGSDLVGRVISEVEYASRGGDPWPDSVHVHFPGVTDMPDPPFDLDQGPEAVWEHYEQPSWVESFEAAGKKSFPFYLLDGQPCSCNVPPETAETTTIYATVMVTIIQN